MTTLITSEGRPALGIRASKASPVIIASDGQLQSDGALALGTLLAGTEDALRVVSVLRPSPIVPDVGVSMTTDIDRIRRADLHEASVRQTTRMFGSPFAVEMRDGDPASVVAGIAHESGATLIVCGLGRHNVVDRILGDETALRLVRLADVPVLAVAEKAVAAPSSIVVACDFSETSLRAARLAATLAAPSATMYLVHVAPRDQSRYEWEGWGKAYKEDALDALAQTKHQVKVEDRTILQPIMLQGDTAADLLRFATASMPISSPLAVTGTVSWRGCSSAASRRASCARRPAAC
jgi:nucleotide-binding universal stress UspA family protein